MPDYQLYAHPVHKLPKASVTTEVAWECKSDVQTAILNVLKRAFARKLYLFQALVEITEGGFFATICQALLNVDRMPFWQPSIIWILLCIIPLTLWFIALRCYEQFVLAGTRRQVVRALLFYFWSLTTFGWILLTLTLAGMYYASTSIGLSINPAPYLWYSTYLASSILVLVAFSDFHESGQKVTPFFRCMGILIPVLVLLLIILLPMTIPLVGQIMLGSIESALITGLVVIINVVGCFFLYGRNRALLDQLVSTSSVAAADEIDVLTLNLLQITKRRYVGSVQQHHSSISSPFFTCKSFMQSPYPSNDCYRKETGYANEVIPPPYSPSFEAVCEDEAAFARASVVAATLISSNWSLFVECYVKVAIERELVSLLEDDDLAGGAALESVVIDIGYGAPN
ncbi:hypothetical protein BJ742DRAFT_740333 [Cladochytrium replicatum]|nr:hypothetical protein BJ742DRAFT_740333 [Cladochytrium replicatum]